MTDETLFTDALALPDPAERAAFLSRVCPDPAQRQRVEELLAAHHADGSFLTRPAGANLMSTEAYEPLVEEPGSRVGPYKLLQQIGEGGMGTVFMAEQEVPVRRKVALKIIKPGMDSKQVVARFEAERQALSMMDHPNIAKVLDAGTTASGRPYFVMELVHGVPITEFCDANKFTPQQRLELFVPVCQAIQHAHMKGIIHRDIKPSNVLVTMYDDKPVPKVIDFGVAKAVEQRLTEKTLFTQYGALMGTFEYMSPEQAEMNAFGVDTRSDVYSLGVLLYELLTGSTPLERGRLRTAALGEVVRLIKEEEPPRPSQRLSTSGTLAKLAAARKTEPGKLSGLVRGELDWIVMRCLEKDRTRRYETATGLAKDVQRYLSGDAVEACPPTLGYRLKKAYRKNKAQLWVGAIVGAALMLGVVGLIEGYFQARSAEAFAEVKRIEAEENAKRADESKREAVNAQLEADNQRNEALLTAYTAQMNLAARAWEDNNVPRARELLESVPTSVAGRDLRGFEWQYLSRVCNSALRTFQGYNGISSVAFSPDGQLFATGTSGRQVRVWSCETGKELFVTGNMTEGAVLGVAFSPDGKRIAGCGADNRGAMVWDSRTGVEILSLQGHKHFVTSIVYSADGQRIATASYDGTVKVWDSMNGKELMSFDHSSKQRSHFGYLYTLAFSPDGQRLASAGVGGSIKIWDISKGKESFTIKAHTSTIWSVKFSPDGKHLVSGSSDKTVKFWDSSNGNELMTIKSTTGDIYSVAYSPDGRRLAGGGDKKVVKIWDTNTGEELASIKGHGDEVKSVTFSRDGRRIASASSDRTAKIWDTSIHNEPLTLDDFGPVAFSRNGRYVATRGNQLNTVTVWDHDKAKAIITFNGHTSQVDQLAISGDGRYLASVSKKDSVRKLDQVMKVWETDTGRELFSINDSDLRFGIEKFAFSPDGRHLAITSDQLVIFWESATGKKLSSFDTDYQGAWSLVYSPNGKQVTTTYEHFCKSAQVWDSTTHKKLQELDGHTDIVTCIAYSPGGSRLATASFDKTVKIWDAVTGRALFSLKGHTEAVRSVAYHPDGTRIATSSQDGTLKIWDNANGKELISLKDPGSSAASVGFSPDGECLVSQDRDGRVKVWGKTGATPIWCQDYLLQTGAESRTTYQLIRRAKAYWAVGKKDEARKLFKAWIKTEVDAEELNTFAMSYAVNNDSKDRDAELAVEAATRACELTQYSQSMILDTLATAYAAKGDFDNAVKWQLKAIELLKDERFRSELESNLKLFREKKTVSPPK